MAAEMVRDELKMTNVRERPQLQIFIEEDFLVPDVKPDVGRIIAADGEIKLGEKENFGGSLRLGGEFLLKVLYVPSSGEENFPLEVMDVKTAFRHDEEFLSGDSELEILPKVEHLDYSLVNERKLRVKAIVSMNIKEYEIIEKSLFSGFREEPLEMLEKTLRYTGLAERKKDYIEVKEEAKLRDGMPEIGRVLKSDFSVGETYRQISGEKAIISGAIYYHILYISDELEPAPVFFQGKVDFTQFIRIEKGEGLSASDVSMVIDDIKVTPKADEDENMTIFDLVVGVSTRLDLYREEGTKVVEDAYHNKKLVEIETETIACSLRKGSGSSDGMVKETVGLPAGAEGISEILYLSGEAFAAGGEIEKDRAIIEGVLEAEIIYSSSEAPGNIRSITEELPFRAMVEVPGLSEGMEIKADFFVKRLNFEKINDRQLEISGEIGVVVTAMEKKLYQFVKSAAIFEDPKRKEENETKIVLYVTRPGDRMWDLGKRYQTSVEEIRAMNGIPEEEELAPGRKMLIWC